MKTLCAVVLSVAMVSSLSAQNYINIAGPWSGSEKVTLTITADGQTTTDTQEGAGSFTITQTGNKVRFTSRGQNPLTGQQVSLLRSGTVSGNKMTCSGQAMIFEGIPGLSVSQNTLTIVGTITGTTMKTHSSGYISGTYQGASFYVNLSSTGTFTGNRTPVPPHIVLQPLDQTVVAGNPAIFYAQASGMLLRCQWQKDGVDIPRATNATYTIQSAQTNHVGAYTFSARNFDGQVFSRAALLAVVPSPFTDVTGTYHGLYYTPADVQPESSGYLRLTLNRQGAYTGKLVTGLQTNNLTGYFDATGRAAKTINRTGKPALQLSMQVDTTRAEITGTVACGSWVSELDAVLAITGNHAVLTNFVGRSTALLPASNDGGGALPLTGEETIGPGYAMLRVDSTGVLVLSGKTGDLQPFAETVGISQTGEWPIYLPLYNGKGMVIGWHHFGEGEEHGLVWLRPANPLARYYPQGFVRTVWPKGQAYKLALPMLEGTEGEMIFTGGNLPAALTNRFRLGTSSNVVNLSGRPMAVTLKPTTGQFSGWFRYPGQTRTNKFEGVVLQEDNYGAGAFLGTGGRSGTVWLIPE